MGDRLDQAIACFQQAIQLNNNDLLYHNNLARALIANNQMEEAIACYRKVLRIHPGSPWGYNTLAWSLVSCPDLKFRNPKEAVALASKAVEIGGKDAEFLNTLGVAYYRNGEWQSAVENLTQAMKLREERKANNKDSLFFLAMAYWQLGDKDQARTCYDKAVQWMTENKLPANLVAELERRRGEAAELMGIEESPIALASRAASRAP